MGAKAGLMTVTADSQNIAAYMSPGLYSSALAHCLGGGVARARRSYGRGWSVDAVVSGLS